MADEKAYIDRSLRLRTDEAGKLAGQALLAVTRRNSAAGRLASGMTLIEFRTEALRVFTEEFNKSAQFYFNLTGKHDGPPESLSLSYASGRMLEQITEQLRIMGARIGVNEVALVKAYGETSDGLIEKRIRLLDDFEHGMIGNEKLKKEIGASIINNQINSPGAVQQAGIGTFSQTGFIQQHQELVNAIDRALTSDEFKALDEAKKSNIQDIAELVKDEAAKSPPDAKKLKKWADHLQRLFAEVGMRVATSELAALIIKIWPL